MLTCKELDQFVDRLCDLTREMDGLDRAREATELLDQRTSVAQQFLMQWRAAAVADLHYLQGVSLRSIAAELGKAFQGVPAWLRDYGPTHYVSLIKEGGPPVRAVLFAVDADGKQTKMKIRQYRAAGRRIVPAVCNIIDPQGPGGIRAGTDLDRLWNRLGE